MCSNAAVLGATCRARARAAHVRARLARSALLNESVIAKVAAETMNRSRTVYITLP